MTLEESEDLERLEHKVEALIVEVRMLEHLILGNLEKVK